MNIRLMMSLALPIVLSSSLALAQQQGSPSTTSTGDQTQKKDDQPKKKKTTTDGKMPAASKGDKKGATTGDTAITNEDEDLDLKVGKARTTSAEPQKQDVVESRAEQRREVEGHRWNVAPLFGYGTNSYNIGIGARAGYTFEQQIYVGGTFMYHFGEQTAVVGQGVSETQSRFYYPAGEVGYDFGIGPMLLRPYGGIGVLFGRNSVSVNGIEATNTQSALMLYPGLTAQYMFPNSPAFVGADMRGLIPVQNLDPSFAIAATAGLSL